MSGEGGGSSASLIDIERPLPNLTGDLVAQVERNYFTRLLAYYKGNVASCARHSGLSRRSVTQKLQKYDLDRTRFEDASTKAVVGPYPRRGDADGDPRAMVNLEVVMLRGFGWRRF